MNSGWFCCGRGRVAALLLFALCAAVTANSEARRHNQSEQKPVVVAQISDTHLGLAQSSKTGEPIDAAGQLRRIVDLVNSRHPDAVIVSGDIGETPQAWQQARDILGHLDARVYFVPGNHDENGHNLERYRAAFGPSYYEFRVGFVEFYALDSQLLGNFENFPAQPLPPMTPQAEAASAQMFSWLAQEAAKPQAKDVSVRVAVQHVPFSRGGDGQDLGPDPKPYWSVPEPYRSEEINALRQLGIRDVLEGHWHSFKMFQADGFTHRVAPATSWPTAGPLGFALHTITRDANVQTELVQLP
jgi:3',5'-cyclic AMP phosphodiesterase CpdA